MFRPGLVSPGLVSPRDLFRQDLFRQACFARTCFARTCFARTCFARTCLAPISVRRTCFAPRKRPCRPGALCETLHTRRPEGPERTCFAPIGLVSPRFRPGHPGETRRGETSRGETSRGRNKSPGETSRAKQVPGRNQPGETSRAKQVAGETSLRGGDVGGAGSGCGLVWAGSGWRMQVTQAWVGTRGRGGAVLNSRISRCHLSCWFYGGMMAGSRPEPVETGTARPEPAEPSLGTGLAEPEPAFVARFWSDGCQAKLCFPGR